MPQALYQCQASPIVPMQVIFNYVILLQIRLQLLALLAPRLGYIVAKDHLNWKFDKDFRYKSEKILDKDNK